MNASEKIVDALRIMAAPICDDCLTVSASLSLRQQTNQGCRKLQNAGVVLREHSFCRGCHQTKLVNSLINSEMTVSLEPEIPLEISYIASDIPDSEGTSMKTIYLISCVSAKRNYASKAKELYISDLFTKARNYVEATGDAWYVLSAEHGLLSPEDILEPYNNTLNTMPINERRVWGKHVFAKLSGLFDEGDTVVFLAGTKYREFLSQSLADAGMKVEIPLEGKRIGEQLSWLKRQMNVR